MLQKLMKKVEADVKTFWVTNERAIRSGGLRGWIWSRHFY
ncbi:hypothetical protein E2C01_036526 [Portunus trituberculatus]|uniref:Uncharacterized protein n=1 Tax=Portunus trituberculatus TaxID=210409 RepID=A0A5B7FBM1_PORTR|nr:hypothetical protein [Portunus trituberculatus]